MSRHKMPVKIEIMLALLAIISFLIILILAWTFPAFKKLIDTPGGWRNYIRMGVYLVVYAVVFTLFCLMEALFERLRRKPPGEDEPPAG